MYSISIYAINGTLKDNYVKDTLKEILELALMFSKKYTVEVLNNHTGELLFLRRENGEFYMSDDICDFIFRKI